MTRRNNFILAVASTLFMLVAAVFILGNGQGKTPSTKNSAEPYIARSAVQAEKPAFRTHDKCTDAEEACLPPEQPPVLPLSGSTIMLDAGHGGTDTGAIRNGIFEKDINLSVTLKLRDVLVKQGATVILTRDTDIALSLDERKALIALHAPTLFVSVHSNANLNPLIDGIEAYYYNDASDTLAQSIYQAVIDGLGEHGNWVRKRELAVVHHEFAPATLIEIGYLSNPAGRALLVKDDYQDRVADSIYKGILNYVSSQRPGAGSPVTPKEPVAPAASPVSDQEAQPRATEKANSASALTPTRFRIGPPPLVQR